MILNLGSGGEPIPGAVNLDREYHPMVNMCHDLEDPLPFEDSVFEKVVAHHIVEHIKNLPQLMGEIYRVCKNGATVHITVPHFTNPTFYDDITHVRPWTERTAKFLEEQRFDNKRGFHGSYKVLQNITLGEPWSLDKPTCQVVDLMVVKGE